MTQALIKVQITQHGEEVSPSRVDSLLCQHLGIEEHPMFLHTKGLGGVIDALRTGSLDLATVATDEFAVETIRVSARWLLANGYEIRIT